MKKAHPLVVAVFLGFVSLAPLIILEMVNVVWKFNVEFPFGLFMYLWLHHSLFIFILLPFFRKQKITNASMEHTDKKVSPVEQQKEVVDPELPIEIDAPDLSGKMPKKGLIIAGVVVGLLLIFGAYWQMQQTGVRPAALESTTPSGTAAMESDSPTETPTTLGASPQYIAFEADTLSSTATQRRVLFFYANWCPTCKEANDEFVGDLSELPSNVALIRVNYNDSDTDQAEKDLAKKYAVTYQHTFVQIDADGNEVAKWNGGELDELLSRLQ